MNDRDLIAELRRLDAAATPGPWTVHDMADNDFTSENDAGWWWVWQESKLPYYGGVLEAHRGGKVGEADPPGSAIGVASITDGKDGHQERADAELIAALRTHLPRLLAALEEARKERDLAIAHDRQPYPTAWAYGQACEALERHRERADKAEAALETARQHLREERSCAGRLQDQLRAACTEGADARARVAELEAETVSRAGFDAFLESGHGLDLDELRADYEAMRGRHV
jgi:hypothetical protein